MKHITTQRLTAVLCASIALTLPLVVAAHGGVPDGHVEEAMETVAHSAGSSELLKAWTPRWWGLLLVSGALTGGLSYGVWKYLHVAPPKVKK